MQTKRFSLTHFLHVLHQHGIIFFIPRDWLQIVSYLMLKDLINDKAQIIINGKMSNGNAME